MRTFLAFARASHLGPTVVMTTAVTGLSWAASWDARQLVVGALAVLTGQLSVGWSNDAHDADLDRRVGRSDKPAVIAGLSADALWRGAFAAGLVAIPLSWLAAGWLGGSFHLLGVAAAWLYNIALSRTVWSWLPYAVAFACIAPYVTFGAPGAPPPAAWFVVALAVLGVGAHAANALADVDHDRRAGVGGVAQALGRNRTLALALMAVAGATTMLVAVTARTVPSAALALVGATAAASTVVAVRRQDDRAVFSAIMLLALADVVIIAVGGVPLTG